VSEREKRMERYRKEIQKDVDAAIEETMRTAALPNTLAWIGVVAGSFAINLLLLVAVSGG
jgi:hypothetical protein